MPAFNSTTLVGNLSRDPELRHTPKGTAVAELGLAINRRYTVDGDQREDVTYIDITFWGKAAETLDKYVSKGDPLLVQGRLHQDKWQDKDTGQNRYKLKVIGENFQFLGGANKDTTHHDPQQDRPANFNQPTPPPATTGTGPLPAGSDDEEDDIPF